MGALRHLCRRAGRPDRRSPSAAGAATNGGRPRRPPRPAPPSRPRSTLSDSGKHAEAEAAFAKIAADGTAGYRVLARIREAAELVDDAIRKAAVAAYRRSSPPMARVDQALHDLAALRAGALLVDTAPIDEIAARLEPLTQPDRTFRHTARELLALAAWRQGDARRHQALVRHDPRPIR